MMLFRACLQLIKDDNVEIQYEKNLILAMKIINEFELNLLPVQGKFILKHKFWALNEYHNILQ